MSQGIVHVICAAGDGTRTQAITPLTPKPLLRLQGRTLLERSLASLDLYPNDVVVVVGRKEHRLRRAEAALQAAYPYVRLVWVELEGRTRGQLHTAYLARDHWPEGMPVAIFNADTFFRCRTLNALQQDPGVDGIVPCSEELGDAWSFCRLGEQKHGPHALAAEVAEKRRISSWCSVGYYFFRDPNVFLQAAQQALEGPAQGELYVAPVYNKLIAAGLQVAVPHAETFLPMGSLAQLADYWKADLEALRAQNRVATLVVDLDDTLTIDDSATDYAHKLPRTAVIERLRVYEALGYEIIVHSARRMRTMRRDEGRVVADVAHDTIAWLRRHGVPFSGLKFGKPHAEGGFYVDDRAVRPSEFLQHDKDALEQLLARDKARLTAAPTEEPACAS